MWLQRPAVGPEELHSARGQLASAGEAFVVGSDKVCDQGLHGGFCMRLAYLGEGRIALEMDVYFHGCIRPAKKPR